MNLTEFLNKGFFRGVSNGQFLGMVFGLAAAVIIMLLMGSTILGWLLAALVGYMIPHLFHATHKEKAVYGAVACVCILLAGGADLNPASVDAMKDISDCPDFKDIELRYDAASGDLIVSASSEATVSRTSGSEGESMTFAWAGNPADRFSELRSTVESFIGRDVGGSAYSTMTVDHGSATVAAVYAQSGSTTYIRFAASAGSMIADAASSGPVAIAGTGTAGTDGARAFIGEVCDVLASVPGELTFTSGASYAAASFSASAGWSVDGAASGVARLAYSDGDSKASAKVFVGADSESRYSGLSGSVRKLVSDEGYDDLRTTYGDCAITAAGINRDEGYSVRFAVQYGDAVVDAFSGGGLRVGSAADAKALVESVAKAVFDSHSEVKDAMTRALLASEAVIASAPGSWALSKISGSDTVPVLRYGGTIDMIVFGGIYGPSRSNMDCMDFDGVARLPGWDTGSLHYFRLAMTPDLQDGTSARDRDEVAFKGFTDASVFTGDATGILWTGAAYGTAFFAVIFFFITACAWFFRRTMTKARKKMEDQGRLYPQGYGRCAKCNAIVLPGEVECRKCGAYIDRPDEMRPGKVDYFRCESCGSEVPSDAETCPKCGAVFAGEETDIVCADGTLEAAVECPECGEIVPAGADGTCICPKCGKRLQTGDDS